MTKTLLFMPFWVRDYLATTRALSLAQKGALTDLLFFAWDIGPLPDDSGPLMRMLGIGYQEFCDVVIPLLDTHFVKNVHGHICERLELERRKSLALRASAHERAKAGGDSTKQKWETDPAGMAARRTSSSGKHQPKPS